MDDKALDISICTYKDGLFEVIIRDGKTKKEVTLSGSQKLSEEEFYLVNDLAPACVMTRYRRKA